LAAGGSGEDFRAGIERAVALGWLWLHESGTYLKFTDAGAALFAYSHNLIYFRFLGTAGIAGLAAGSSRSRMTHFDTLVRRIAAAQNIPDPIPLVTNP
jgi:hypothetical protein